MMAEDDEKKNKQLYKELKGKDKDDEEKMDVEDQ